MDMGNGKYILTVHVQNDDFALPLVRSTWAQGRSLALCAKVPWLRDWAHTILSKVITAPHHA